MTHRPRQFRAWLAGLALPPLAAGLVWLMAARPVSFADTRPTIASYYYSGIPMTHIDALAERGFNTALIKYSQQKYGAEELADMEAKAAYGAERGVKVMPVANAHNRTLTVEATDPLRRFRRTNGRVWQNVPCPNDFDYWRAVWEGQMLPAYRAAGRLAIDLELYRADNLHHWPATPCTCDPCILEYTGYTDENAALAAEWRDSLEPRDFEDLGARQLAHLAAFWTRVLGEEAFSELAVLDLGRDGLVTRALAIAAERLELTVYDFTELTYGRGLEVNHADLTAAYRERDLNVRLVPGFWLLKWEPAPLGDVAEAAGRDYDGYWIFTSYSLHVAPDRLEGDYRLEGTQAEYWQHLRRANRSLVPAQ